MTSLRRLTSSLAVAVLATSALVALGGGAAAAPTPVTDIASGDSAFPDVPTILTANGQGLVYQIVDAANRPTLWAQKLSGGVPVGVPVELTGNGWTELTADGFRPGFNLSVAGSMIAAAGTPFSSFGTEQQRVGIYDLATGTATNPIITGSGDGDGGFGGFNQVFFAGAAPDGFLFVKLVPADGETPASVSVVDESQARDNKVDLGQLPDASADPELLATITTATSPTGTVIAYPTTLVVDGQPQDSLAFVPYGGDPIIVLATADAGTFDASLVTGGGRVAWADHGVGDENPGCHYFTLPLDGSGNGIAQDHHAEDVCDVLGGITATTLVLSPFPVSAGEAGCPVSIQTCASGRLATLDLATDVVTTSTTVDALSAGTDGTRLYYSIGGSIGSAGIYGTTSLGSAGTAVVVAAAKPLTVLAISTAPGRITWTDDSTSTYPVTSRTVTSNGTTLDLGTPGSVVGTSVPRTPDMGYGVSTSGKRTAYAAPPTSGDQDRLLVAGPGGTQLVTTFAGGSPSLDAGGPQPATVQVSGSNVLYLTDDPDGGYDGHVYSTATHETIDFPRAAAYALSGGYLAWLAEDGSVMRKDLVADSAPVQLRPATALDSGEQLDVSGQVAAAGDHVSWLVRECITSSEDSTCDGDTEAGYRNAATMTAATIVVSAATVPPAGTTPLTPLNIAMSADYLALDELNPAFNPHARRLVAIKLTDGTSTIIGTNNYVSGSGKFAVDGAIVSWIDAGGEAKAEAIDAAATVDVPRVLTVDAPWNVTLGTASPFEVVASARLDDCSVTIRDAADAVVRTLECADVDGDGIVTWNGTDDSSSDLPLGTYSWTITGANAGGDLLDHTGAAQPVTGEVTLTAESTTAATWPTSVTYGQAFAVDVTVSGSGATPTGTVTLSEGGTTLDTQPLVGGAATLHGGSTALAPGAHSLTVAYSGSDSYGTSTADKDVTVQKAAATVVAAVPSTQLYGNTWQVPVTVSATGTTPTGTVTLMNGTTTLASQTLSGGAATLTVVGTRLVPGAYTLTVRYGGSSTVASAQVSKPLTVAKARATVTERLRKAKVKRSRHAKLVVEVTATGGVPVTGRVRVFDGRKRIAVVTLTRAMDGRVVVRLPRLSVGKHRIHAKYGGSATVERAKGGVLILKVVRG